MPRYHIDQKDYDDPKIKDLPIRRGCSGLCACLGTCKLVVGSIKRNVYESFLTNRIYFKETVHEFLENWINK